MGSKISSFETEQKNEKTGVKISPSNFETLFEIEKLSTPNETYLPELIIPEYETILSNAESSIQGTHLHTYSYFTLLFLRAETLGRKPTIQDYMATFPFQKPLHYKAIDFILSQSESSLEMFNNYITTGQQYYYGNPQNLVISPQKIKELWEKGISKESMQMINSNLSKIGNEKTDPRETIVFNESPFINYILFKNFNLLVPTFIDEITIFLNQRNGEKMIRLLDYKTGKQFNKPTLEQYTQILLMTTSVFSMLYDRIHLTKIEPNKFPKIKSKRTQKNSFFGTISVKDILDIRNLVPEVIDFSYVNPLTQQSIKVDIEFMFSGETKFLENILGNLARVTEFYISKKKELSPYFDKNMSPYYLPKFPREDFFDIQDTERRRQFSLSI